MKFFGRKPGVIEPTPEQRARQFNEQWALVEHAPELLTEADIDSKRREQGGEASLAKIPAESALSTTRKYTTWTNDVKKLRSDLTTSWLSDSLREQAVQAIVSAADKSQKELMTRHWPGQLNEFAKSDNLALHHVSPRLAANSELCRAVTTLIAKDLIVQTRALHALEGDSVGVSRLHPGDIRIDWWRRWAENEFQPDQRYSYMTFELGFRGSVLTLSQHSGTLWFQRRIVDQIRHELDASDPDPITPFLRVAFANAYRDYFASIHQLYTGSVPRPVPAMWSGHDRSGWVEHQNAIIGNAERAARYDLRYCEAMDSLIHFDMQSMRLGEGSRLGELFIAAGMTASAIVNAWGNALVKLPSTK